MASTDSARFISIALLLVLSSACKGSPDGSGTALIEDADGDGFEREDADCDDNNPAVHPGAVETIGDGMDADCDGLDGSADSLTHAASATLTGDEAHPRLGNEVLIVDDMTGDSRAEVAITRDVIGLPNSAEELTSEVMLFKGPFTSTMSTEDAIRWGGDDHFHAPVLASGDMNGDGLTELVVGELSHSEPKGGSGRVWIVDGSQLPETKSNNVESLTDLIAAENALTYLGAAVSLSGDLNGDGLADLLVGAHRGGGPNPTPGAALVFEGPIHGIVWDTEATLQLTGELPNDYVGSSLTWAGDVNGDGHDDMFIGAPANFAEDTRGRAYLVYGPHNGTMSLENADATIQGEIDGGNLGHIVSRAGDTNNDGLADLLIGAPLTDAEGQRSGRAWLFSGPLEGTYVASDADATFLSAGELDWTGYDVESAGDVNNDGFDDVLITSPQQYRYVPSRLARVSLFYGPLGGELTPDDADRVWASPYPHDTAGRSIAVGGDLNADGRRDLVVGAPYDDEGGYEAGAVYLLTLE